MSLDVSLSVDKIESYDGGKTFKEAEEWVFDANITHNLTKMADAAGIYQALWSPLENGWAKAKDISESVEKGLKDMKERPEHYKQFNASNGWGLYKHFIPWIEEYLNALKEYPNAKISISK